MAGRRRDGIFGERMRERTPDFLAAQDRVKVGHFTRQGFDLEGVIHVGANGGLEIKYYLELGAPKVIGFEPYIEAFKALKKMFESDYRVTLLACALGEKEGWRELNVTQGDGQGSSFLKEIDGPYTIAGQESRFVRRGEDYMRAGGYNTLVVDVQGMELEVLKGFGEKLKQFSFLNIECSETSLYEGGVDAKEVVQYLDSMGFDQDSPIVSHDDIMFIRKGLK
jgi:FkbM family methyltransferase